MPSFSQGTVPLDQNTGRPAAPAFTDGKVAVQEPAVGAAPVRPDVPRETRQTEQPDGATAAEQAAEAIADAFGDYEEFEIDDGDIETKYPIRVPKQYAASAKKGYSRRAAFDRKFSRYNAADPVLGQLIEDGRIQPILPMLQAALDDPQGFGEYVTQGYRRKQQGLPLIEQARQEAAAAAQAPPPQAFDLSADDPFLAEQVRPYVEPLQQQVQTLTQRLEAEDQERARVRQAQQSEAQVMQWREGQMRLAHQDLANRYPGTFFGDLTRDNRDSGLYSRAVKYAAEAGYVDAYGPRAAIVFAGDQIVAMERERIAATGSTAAQTLQHQETQLTDLARQQAAQASRTVGGGSPTQAPVPAPPSRPSTMNPDGTMKPVEQYLREQQAYMAAQRVPA